MKRLLLAATSIVLISLVTAPNAHARNGSDELTPFELVNLARNGYLINQGIPAFARLSSDYRQGRISAEDLIRGAINNNRITSEALEDQSYIRAVERSLYDLGRD